MKQLSPTRVSLALALGLTPSVASAMDVAFMGWADFQMKLDSSEQGALHFDQTHLYLIADARVNKAWSVFAEVELEHLPEVSEEQTLGTIKLERSYIQHETARTRLRLGRMVMPFGIRIPAHWLMTTPILTRPPIEDMGHVQTHFVGVEGQYRLDIGKSTVDITGTIHNGPETHGTEAPTDGLSGFGGDIKWQNSHFQTVGASVARSSADDGHEHNHTAIVAYTDLNLPANLGLRAESAIFNLADLTEHWSHYLLGTYRLHPYDALSVSYRFAFGTTGLDMSSTAPMHTTNLSWNPGNGVRIVAEHHVAQGSDALESDATAHDHSADHNHSGASGATTSGVVHTGILWLGASF